MIGRFVLATLRGDGVVDCAAGEAEEICHVWGVKSGASCWVGG